MIIIVVNYPKIITGYYLLPIDYLLFLFSTTKSIHLLWYLNVPVKNT